MFGHEDDAPAPPPATLSDAPERVTELAFALSDPERTALLAALAQEGLPQTAEGLAASLDVDPELTKAHLKVLVSAGLVATKRSGLRRLRTYVPTMADLEMRFFHGARPSSEETIKVLARDAKRRERQKKKLVRKERRIAKEARRL